jgi:hypothetical protein
MTGKYLARLLKWGNFQKAVVTTALPNEEKWACLSFYPPQRKLKGKLRGVAQQNAPSDLKNVSCFIVCKRF